jgi:hypothetical protein
MRFRQGLIQRAAANYGSGAVVSGLLTRDVVAEALGIRWFGQQQVTLEENR